MYLPLHPSGADDMVIAPFFQRRGRPISQLVRIGIGYAVACLAMVVAAIVEICRLQVVKDNNLQDSDPTAPGAPVVPMSVWIQIPQYALIGECTKCCSCPWSSPRFTKAAEMGPSVVGWVGKLVRQLPNPALAPHPTCIPQAAARCSPWLVPTTCFTLRQAAGVAVGAVRWVFQ
jgi:hypothetical protein